MKLFFQFSTLTQKFNYKHFSPAPKDQFNWIIPTYIWKSSSQVRFIYKQKSNNIKVGRDLPTLKTFANEFLVISQELVFTTNTAYVDKWKKITPLSAKVPQHEILASKCNTAFLPSEQIGWGSCILRCVTDRKLLLRTHLFSSTTNTHEQGGEKLSHECSSATARAERVPQQTTTLLNIKQTCKKTGHL